MHCIETHLLLLFRLKLAQGRGIFTNQKFHTPFFFLSNLMLSDLSLILRNKVVLVLKLFIMHLLFKVDHKFLLTFKYFHRFVPFQTFRQYS